MPKGAYKRRTYRKRNLGANVRAHIKAQIKYHQSRIKILKLIGKILHG